MFFTCHHCLGEPQFALVWGALAGMTQLFQIASSVSSPLALSGLIAAIVFYTFRQIIAQNIFPKLTSSLGAGIITLIVNRLFFLALVAMLLGFTGYIFTRFAPAPSTENSARDKGVDLDVIHATRQNVSDICVFHMISLVPDAPHDRRSPSKLFAEVNLQTITFPIHSANFDSAPRPYSAKVEVPCSSEYSVSFDWSIRMEDGHESEAGENDFHIVAPGQVVRYGVPWFSSMTYEIGYSARP